MQSVGYRRHERQVYTPVYALFPRVKQAVYTSRMSQFRTVPAFPLRRPADSRRAAVLLPFPSLAD
jgi:hypothetical protein